MSSTNVKSGLWREEVLARADRIAYERDALGQNHPPGIDSDFIAKNITQPVDGARLLAGDPLNPVERWSGSQIEEAWRQLRIAEEALILATADLDVLKGQAQEALAHARGRLDDSDLRVAALQAELGKQTPDAKALRIASAVVVRAAHGVIDLKHQSLRTFRNQLRVVTAFLFLLALVVVYVARRFSLPDDLIAAPPGVSAGNAVLVAMASGAVGSMFSAVPSLAQIPDKESTFNPIREQAALKIVVGALSALVGIVAVAAGLGSSSEGSVGSLAGFMMMTALFGVSQEALTRFADQKASTVRPA